MDYTNFYTQHITLYLTNRHLTMLNHQGQCDEDAKIVAQEEHTQLAALCYKDVIKELTEVGAWSEEELRAEPKEDNFQRLVWVVAGYMEAMNDED
jgi:hypothetical protein